MGIKEISSCEIKKEPPVCAFITGIMAGNDELRGIKTSLESRFEPGNVVVFNSAINTKDKPDPQRFERMADLAESTVMSGRDIIFAPHSLGSVEAYMGLRQLEKRNPSFFEDREKMGHIDVRFLAPTISRGLLVSLWRFGHLLREDAIDHGIDALTAFPPPHIPRHTIVDFTRKAVPDRSQYISGIRVNESAPASDYTEHVSEEDEAILTSINGELETAITAENYNPTLLASHGELLHPYVVKAYNGDYYDGELQPQDESDAFRWTVPATLGLLSMATRMGTTMSWKTPLRKFRKWHDAGMKVRFIIPEYDKISRVDEANDFYRDPSGASLDQILLMAGTTHASFAHQPNLLTESL